MTTATATNDWSQVVTNLQVLIEASGYSFGLEHDLTVAQSELAKLAKQETARKDRDYGLR